MNPLADVLPPMTRKVLYAAVFLGLLVYSAFQLADGDWVAMIGSLLTSLAPLLAASNTPTKPEPVPVEEYSDEDYLDEDDYEGEPEAEAPLPWPGVAEGGERGSGPLPGRQIGS